MKKTLFALALVLFAVSAMAQTSLTQTSLSSAIGSSSVTTVRVASATGISTSPQTILFVDNEAMFVTGVSGTAISVIRGYASTLAVPHISGAMVLAGPPQAYIAFTPSGSCTNGQGVFAYSPVVNLKDGNQWLCSTVLGKVVPGFQNNQGPPQVTTAVASAAGLVTPSGPLFHITGTLAITGFNVPVGFDPKEGGQICAIPDGLFTTTNANNFALATTAVVSKPICWQYDGNTAKFYPSY